MRRNLNAALLSATSSGLALLQGRRRASVTPILDDAVGADAMAEVGLRMRAKVRLDLAPVALVVPHFLAGRADGEKALQDLQLRERLFDADLELVFTLLVEADPIAMDRKDA